MMRRFAKGLAPPVHVFGGVVSESRAGRKRRRLPPMPDDCCRAEKTMKTYAAVQKSAHFHGSIAASSDVAAI